MTTAKKAPRRIERVYAFKVLYGLGFTASPSEADLLRAFQISPERPEHLENEDSFAWRLCFGVWKNHAALDAAISGFSQNWRVERMGRVELTILRIATFELMSARTEAADTEEERNVPAKVVINEAVELSKMFGDDKSRGFINGILDAAAKAKETGHLGVLPQ